MNGVNLSDKTVSQNLLVVGGGDGMGMWLVKRVFGDAPEIGRITLADVKPLQTSGADGPTNPGAMHVGELGQIAKPIDAVRLENGCDFADWAAVHTAASSPADPIALHDYDLVMLAVPENQVELVASTILPRLGRGSSVFDVTSTKAKAMGAMLEYAPDGVGVLGTHPLFGPAVPEAIGQIFIVIPTDRTREETYDWLTALLRSKGAIVEETDAGTHDRYMLLVQTLAHYAYLVFGKTLANASKMGYTLQESFRYSTPPYSILTAFTSRIIGGNPLLYTQIQGQAGSDTLRSIFVDAAQELADRFAQGEPEILSAIEEIIQPFRGSEVARAYANSIALVDSVQESYRDLRQRMESGELTIVQVLDPMASDRVARLHVGVITDVDGRSVEITERQVVVDGKWYIAYNDESEAVLKSSGKSPRRRTIPIQRRNIRRVFTPEETIEWRAANLSHHRRDISVLADESVDLEYICSVLTRINEAVLADEAIETKGAQWLKRYGMNNILLRFTIFGDRDPRICLDDIAKSLQLFGIRTLDHERTRRNPS